MEDLLYRDAEIIKSEAASTADHQKLFEAIDVQKVAVKDNGVIRAEKGQQISKRFKYTNTTAEAMTIEVLSNAPAVVQVRESTYYIKAGETETIKFLIQAP